jgi:DNA-binding response OmpR family regulator/tetratricopeptide (TPR) repeat protein
MTIRILLAEDNENLADMLQRFLTAQGHTVLTVGSGVQALRLLVAEQIDLLLLDLRLPGMSGVEVLQKLRSSPRWRGLPVIVMTGVFKGDRYADAARRLGVCHYLEKPFTREAFTVAVQEAVTAIAAQKAKTTVLDLILDAYNNKRSGQLDIGSGAPVVFVKGEPFSFLTRGREDFTTFLLDKRKVTRDDQRVFLESGEERLFLTQSGMLTYDELLEESQLFLTKRLTESLSVSDGIAFAEGDAEEELPLVHIPVPRLIYDAIKFHPDHFCTDIFWETAQRLYPSRTRLFYRRANLTTMRKNDIDLLEQMSGQRSLGQIVATGPSFQEGAAFFHFLHLLGMIELHEESTVDATPDFPQKNLFNKPIEELKVLEESAIGFEDLVEEVSADVELPATDSTLAEPLSAAEIDVEEAVQRDHAFIKDKNYYELLGLTPATFSFNALKESYFARTRQYTPERFMQLSGATQSMAQDILAEYANAYNTLSNVVAKERYDEMLNADRTLGLDGRQDDRLQARIQFQSAQVFLEMGEYDNAEKALQDAYTLQPDNSRHCAFLAWAIYKNPANRNSRASQDKARNLLAKSLQLEKTAEAFAFRGWMLLDEGRDGLAEGEFLKALKLNPKEMHARKGLRLITERREAEKKGIFKRLFG